MRHGMRVACVYIGEETEMNNQEEEIIVPGVLVIQTGIVRRVYRV